ncbi:MAG: Lrp/AsnC family transcriptional regulator [Clostridia bacterium]|nr:Lrp/AsnC family transcriptional regulator [Clostridia bacterium]
MDITDLKIIELLQNNARISISEISKKVNMSISAVGERLKKLESSGIIKQYTVILDSILLHKELSVIMSIRLERPEFTEDFLDFINSENEILECHYITGEYDYSLKIITHSTITLERIMNKIKSIPGIQKTQTNVILSTHKNNYSVIPSNE